MYVGDLENALEKAGRAIELNPAIRHLIVPGSELAQRRRELRESDSSYVSVCYRKALSRPKEAK